ncbi:Gfo/Idh/MocA family oxidoreductase [Hoeflea sp.]|uniref:Gfo/Idh/MocA family protein n=1 Tax=Hoeflea sp. TaxID=1940281 RepID=UPI0019960968|nr:Gfo/Idh/MocA family oxidoreductase [Hoeflea sp.]MBC7284839.1 Gfo/Idh/MocA family oxidoreductase [Hoeflea sp.]
MNPAKQVRWGILGCGWITRDVIAPTLASVSGAVLHSACSRDEERAAQFCAPFGARPYASVQQFLADPELDAVFVATPNHRHVEDVLACAAAGKHVLCDKPLAPTAAEAERLMVACNRAGVKLGVGYQMRFNPIHREVQRRVAQGELGRIAYGHVQACFRYPFPPSEWRRHLASAGGGWATADLGTHLVDLLLWILGPVAEVQAQMDNGAYGYETEDICSAVLRFQSGAMVSMTCATAVSAPRTELAFYGENSSIIAENTIGVGVEGRLLSDKDGQLSTEQMRGGANPYQLELAGFSDAIRQDQEPPVPGEAGVAAAEVLDAIRQSAREGRRFVFARVP